MHRTRNTGFTLVELMVTIAIVAILAAIAFPSFQGTIRSSRVATMTNELIASLSLARSEAIRSTDRTIICASANGTTCGTDWNQGWMVWTEKDGDGVHDGDETVVRYSQGKPMLQVAASAATIAFDGRGRIVGSPATPATIDVVPTGVTAPARCVEINVTGQTRVKQEACP